MNSQGRNTQVPGISKEERKRAQGFPSQVVTETEQKEREFWGLLRNHLGWNTCRMALDDTQDAGSAEGIPQKGQWVSGRPGEGPRAPSPCLAPVPLLTLQVQPYFAILKWRIVSYHLYQMLDRAPGIFHQIPTSIPEIRFTNEEPGARTG